MPSRSNALLAVALLVTGGAAAADRAPAAWNRTLERIAPSVVSIKVDGTRAFDTEWNESSQATGFVVDAERGLILTNRHVVTPGPVRAEALFTNQEEVELTPVYRDPVHDFGFFRYDPRALRYARPAGLPLAPEGAELGREIRVVGNDAGEQLSILSGTIARLRREAPDYGRGQYNDFNTFYLQAASGTSGGSSGSPVIDIDGRVVALNAGASQAAASSFFLPLDRVARALRLLQAGQPVPRGHLGAIFTYRAYDELRRLGLREATESATRRAFPDGTGMLVVSEVVPGTPADGRLEVGDILVSVAGQAVSEFVPLEALLDARVGAEAPVAIERNGAPLVVPVPVQDLEAVSPAEYLQFGDAVVHDLSLQQARHFNRPPRGVYVANPGFVLASAGIPRGALLVGVDGAPVAGIGDLEAALDGLADGQRATLRYVTMDEPAASRLRVIRMDRRWFPAQRCRRDDALGVWPCRELAAGPAPAPPQPATARPVEYRDGRLAKLAPAVVLVNFDMPYTVSGVSEQHYLGTGIVVDAARGLVAVDRNTVPEAIGDVRVTFAGAVEVPGRVAFLHPAHNLALIAYDPALLGETPVTAVRLADREPEAGERLWVVGLRRGEQLVAQPTAYKSRRAVRYPLSRTMRFRDANLETVELQDEPRDVDGMVVNRRNEVVALWSSFAWQGNGDLNQENRGLPATFVAEALALHASGTPLRSLEVEFDELPLVDARRLGLPAAAADALAAHDPERRQALGVLRAAAGTPAAAGLQSGDVLVRIDGEPVTRFREVEARVQKPAVTLEVFRDGALRTVELATVPLAGDGVRRLVFWGGAVVQAPYRDMALQRSVPGDGVYVAFFAFGSPASRYGLYAGRRITAVDGQPVADLDAFVDLVRRKRDRESVRLDSVTWNNQREVLTLKVDDTYWPAYQIRWRDGEWRREPL